MGQGPGPTSDLFAGLPFEEAELLAYVEGDGGGARQGELAAYLQSRPDVRRALDAMKEDRVVLCQAGDAKAPEGIVEEAMAVLEREALLGESRIVEPAPAAIPIQRAQSARAMRALAMAAGFLLLAGGASYWISQVVTPAGPPGGQNPRGEQSADRLATESGPTRGDTRVADATVAPPTSPLPPIEETFEEEPGETESPAWAHAEPDEVLEHGVGLPSGIGSSTYYPIATISPTRALELARERRLAICLTCKERKGRTDSRMAAGDGRDVPSTGSLVIELPATEDAISDLYASLAENADGTLSLEELPEAFDSDIGNADYKIADYSALDSSAERVTVPVIVSE